MQNDQTTVARPSTRKRSCQFFIGPLVKYETPKARRPPTLITFSWEKMAYYRVCTYHELHSRHAIPQRIQERLFSSRVPHRSTEIVRSRTRLKRDATHSSIMAGWIQLSKKPSRNLTTIRGAKLDEAAEQATTAPQQNTLTARTFASGSFCRR